MKNNLSKSTVDFEHCDKGSSNNYWENKSVSFVYKDVQYTENIKNNLRLTNINPIDLKRLLNETPAKHAYWGSLLADVNKEIADVDKNYNTWYASKYVIHAKS